MSKMESSGSKISTPKAPAFKDLGVETLAELIKARKESRRSSKCAMSNRCGLRRMDNAMWWRNPLVRRTELTSFRGPGSMQLSPLLRRDYLRRINGLHTLYVGDPGRRNFTRVVARAGGAGRLTPPSTPATVILAQGRALKCGQSVHGAAGAGGSARAEDHGNQAKRGTERRLVVRDALQRDRRSWASGSRSRTEGRIDEKRRFADHRGHGLRTIRIDERVANFTGIHLPGWQYGREPVDAFPPGRDDCRLHSSE